MNVDQLVDDGRVKFSDAPVGAVLYTAFVHSDKPKVELYAVEVLMPNDHIYRDLRYQCATRAYTFDVFFATEEEARAYAARQVLRRAEEYYKLGLDLRNGHLACEGAGETEVCDEKI